MKIFLPSTTKKLSRVTKIILIINLLSGCAAIPAGKVNPDDYPEVSEREAKNLKLFYEYDRIRDEINNTPYNQFEGVFAYKDEKGHFRYGSTYEKTRNKEFFDLRLLIIDFSK